MHQKLLQKAGLLGLMIVAAGCVLSSCIDEPTPAVIDQLNSEVRFVHADPSTGAVDLWVDGVKQVSSLEYKNFHQYMKVKSGVRLIQLTQAGKSDTVGALFSSMTSIRSLMQMTIFFYPGVDGMTYYVAQEKFTYANEEANVPADSARVKVINLTNQAAKFLKGEGGQEVFAEVAAGTLTPYRNFIAGESFQCWVVNPSAAKLTDTQVNPEKKKRYTYFLMGMSEPYLLVMTDNALPTYP